MRLRRFKDKKLEKYTIVCETKNTRNGFKHEATLLDSDYEIAFAKCTYLNRTWEAYPYQTAMLNVVDKSPLDSDTKALLKEELRGY